MKIFIICSVRNAGKEYIERLFQYVENLESMGHSVHFPHRDTNQNASGLDICRQNRAAIKEADEVHLFYSKTSEGSLFDVGMTFMAEIFMPLKKFKVIENIEYGEGKSFPRMFDEWQSLDY
jgi:hypothetical protein